jgi:hypothetical protein
MSDLGYILCAIAAWAYALFKYRTLGKAPPERKAPIRAMIASSVLGGAPMFLGADVVGLNLSRAVGIPHFAVLLGWSLAAAFICATQIMLLYWRHPDRAWPATRRLIIIYTVVICAMVTLYTLSPGLDDRYRGVAVSAQGAPLLVAMLALYFTAFLLGFCNIVRLCWGWASEVSDQVWLRRGFRIVAVGMLFAAVYSAMCLVGVVGGQVDPALRRWSVYAPSVAGLGVPLVLIGYSIPRWGPWLSVAGTALRRFRSSLRDHRRLRPLWRALAPVNPAMIHTPGSIAERVNMDVRLFWRVIEINDWLHQLRTYRDPTVAGAVEHRAREAGHAGNELAALSEAAQIKAALASRHRGQRSNIVSTQVVVAAETHRAFASERERLVMIADAFTDPLVDVTVQETDASGATVSQQ